MNSYAISTCLLSKASVEKIICTGVLNKIADNTTPYKVVADKKGRILDLYKNLIVKNGNYEVAIWIKHLTSDPTQIEYLDIDFKDTANEIYYFIETASKIRNKKQLIVYNHGIIPEEYIYDDQTNQIIHNNEVIQVFNTSEAITNFSSDNKSIKIESLNYKTMSMQQENKGNVIVGKGGNASNIQTGSKNKIAKKIQTESLLIGLIIGVIASLIATWIWSKI